VLERATGRIDRRSPVPFYFQLKRLIEDELERERWSPGERMPSEVELCKHFAVSRTTVRQALAELESEGRLQREKGRGTFVAERRPNSWFLQSSQGFYDEAMHAGRRVTSQVLRCELEPLPGWAAEPLEAEAGAPGVALDRLRSVDGEAVMYVESHLDADLADAVLEAELVNESLYHVLRERRGVEVAGGRRVVQATTAHAELARLLEVQAGAPLLLVESVSWDAALRPFECYRAWHRSDRTKIVVQVVGTEAATTAGLDPATLRLERS
jgi:GntR family transcriptional regulator